MQIAPRKVDGAIVLGLLALAAMYALAPFPRDRQEQKDVTVVRAVLLTAVVFFVTDVAPFSAYNVTAYAIGQVVMIAAVRTIGRR